LLVTGCYDLRVVGYMPFTHTPRLRCGYVTRSFPVVVTLDPHVYVTVRCTLILLVDLLLIPTVTLLRWIRLILVVVVVTCVDLLLITIWIRFDLPLHVYVPRYGLRLLRLHVHTFTLRLRSICYGWVYVDSVVVCSYTFTFTHRVCWVTFVLIRLLPLRFCDFTTLRLIRLHVTHIRLPDFTFTLVTRLLLTLLHYRLIPGCSFVWFTICLRLILRILRCYVVVARLRLRLRCWRLTFVTFGLHTFTTRCCCALFVYVTFTHCLRYYDGWFAVAFTFTHGWLRYVAVYFAVTFTRTLPGYRLVICWFVHVYTFTHVYTADLVLVTVPPRSVGYTTLRFARLHIYVTYIHVYVLHTRHTTTFPRFPHILHTLPVTVRHHAPFTFTTFGRTARTFCCYRFTLYVTFTVGLVAWLRLRFGSVTRFTFGLRLVTVLHVYVYVTHVWLRTVGCTHVTGYTRLRLRLLFTHTHTPFTLHTFGCYHTHVAVGLDLVHLRLRLPHTLVGYTFWFPLHFTTHTHTFTFTVCSHTHTAHTTPHTFTVRLDLRLRLRLRFVYTHHGYVPRSVVYSHVVPRLHVFAIYVYVYGYGCRLRLVGWLRCPFVTYVCGLRLVAFTGLGYARSSGWIARSFTHVPTVGRCDLPHCGCGYLHTTFVPRSFPHGWLHTPHHVWFPFPVTLRFTLYYVTVYTFGWLRTLRFPTLRYTVTLDFRLVTFYGWLHLRVYGYGYVDFGYVYVTFTFALRLRFTTFVRFTRYVYRLPHVYRLHVVDLRMTTLFGYVTVTVVDLLWLRLLAFVVTVWFTLLRCCWRCYDLRLHVRLRLLRLGLLVTLRLILRLICSLRYGLILLFVDCVGYGYWLRLRCYPVYDLRWVPVDLLLCCWFTLHVWFTGYPHRLDVTHVYGCCYGLRFTFVTFVVTRCYRLVTLHYVYTSHTVVYGYTTLHTFPRLRLVGWLPDGYTRLDVWFHTLRLRFGLRYIPVVAGFWLRYPFTVTVGLRYTPRYGYGYVVGYSYGWLLRYARYGLRLRYGYGLVDFPHVYVCTRYVGYVPVYTFTTRSRLLHTVYVTVVVLVVVTRLRLRLLRLQVPLRGRSAHVYRLHHTFTLFAFIYVTVAVTFAGWLVTFTFTVVPRGPRLVTFVGWLFTTVTRSVDSPVPHTVTVGYVYVAVGCYVVVTRYRLVPRFTFFATPALYTHVWLVGYPTVTVTFYVWLVWLRLRLLHTTFTVTGWLRYIAGWFGLHFTLRLLRLVVTTVGYTHGYGLRSTRWLVYGWLVVYVAVTVRTCRSRYTFAVVAVTHTPHHTYVRLLRYTFGLRLVPVVTGLRSPRLVTRFYCVYTFTLHICCYVDLHLRYGYHIAGYIWTRFTFTLRTDVTTFTFGCWLRYDTFTRFTLPHTFTHVFTRLRLLVTTGCRLPRLRLVGCGCWTRLFGFYPGYTHTRFPVGLLRLFGWLVGCHVVVPVYLRLVGSTFTFGLLRYCSHGGLRFAHVWFVTLVISPVALRFPFPTLICCYGYVWITFTLFPLRLRYVGYWLDVGYGWLHGYVCWFGYVVTLLRCSGCCYVAFICCSICWLIVGLLFTFVPFVGYVYVCSLLLLLLLRWLRCCLRCDYGYVYTRYGYDLRSRCSIYVYVTLIWLTLRLRLHVTLRWFCYVAVDLLRLVAVVVVVVTFTVTILICCSRLLFDLIDLITLRLFDSTVYVTLDVVGPRLLRLLLLPLIYVVDLLRWTFTFWLRCVYVCWFHTFTFTFVTVWIYGLPRLLRYAVTHLHTPFAFDFTHYTFTFTLYVRYVRLRFVVPLPVTVTTLFDLPVPVGCVVVRCLIVVTLPRCCWTLRLRCCTLRLRWLLDVVYVGPFDLRVDVWFVRVTFTICCSRLNVGCWLRSPFTFTVVTFPLRFGWLRLRSLRYVTRLRSFDLRCYVGRYAFTLLLPFVDLRSWFTLRLRWLRLRYVCYGDYVTLFPFTFVYTRCCYVPVVTLLRFDLRSDTRLYVRYHVPVTLPGRWLPVYVVTLRCLILQLLRCYVWFTVVGYHVTHGCCYYGYVLRLLVDLYVCSHLPDSLRCCSTLVDLVVPVLRFVHTVVGPRWSGWFTTLIPTFTLLRWLPVTDLFGYVPTHVYVAVWFVPFVTGYTFVHYHVRLHVAFSLHTTLPRSRLHTLRCSRCSRLPFGFTFVTFVTHTVTLFAFTLRCCCCLRYVTVVPGYGFTGCCTIYVRLLRCLFTTFVLRLRYVTFVVTFGFVVVTLLVVCCWFGYRFVIYGWLLFERSRLDPTFTRCYMRLRCRLRLVTHALHLHHTFPHVYIYRLRLLHVYVVRWFVTFTLRCVWLRYVPFTLPLPHAPHITHVVGWLLFTFRLRYGLRYVALPVTFTLICWTRLRLLRCWCCCSVTLVVVGLLLRCGITYTHTTPRLHTHGYICYGWLSHVDSLRLFGYHTVYRTRSHGYHVYDLRLVTLVTLPVTCRYGYGYVYRSRLLRLRFCIYRFTVGFTHVAPVDLLLLLPYIWFTVVTLFPVTTYTRCCCCYVGYVVYVVTTFDSLHGGWRWWPRHGGWFVVVEFPHVTVDCCYLPTIVARLRLRYIATFTLRCCYTRYIPVGYVGWFVDLRWFWFVGPGCWFTLRSYVYVTLRCWFGCSRLLTLLIYVVVTFGFVFTFTFVGTLFARYVWLLRFTHTHIGYVAVGYVAFTRLRLVDSDTFPVVRFICGCTFCLYVYLRLIYGSRLRLRLIYTLFTLVVLIPTLIYVSLPRWLHLVYVGYVTVTRYIFVVWFYVCVWLRYVARLLILRCLHTVRLVGYVCVVWLRLRLRLHTRLLPHVYTFTHHTRLRLRLRSLRLRYITVARTVTGCYPRSHVYTLRSLPFGYVAARLPHVTFGFPLFVTLVTFGLPVCYGYAHALRCCYVVVRLIGCYTRLHGWLRLRLPRYLRFTLHLRWLRWTTVTPVALLIYTHVDLRLLRLTVTHHDFTYTRFTTRSVILRCSHGLHHATFPVLHPTHYVARLRFTVTTVTVERLHTVTVYVALDAHVWLRLVVTFTFTVVTFGLRSRLRVYVTLRWCYVGRYARLVTFTVTLPGSTLLIYGYVYTLRLPYRVGCWLLPRYVYVVRCRFPHDVTVSHVTFIYGCCWLLLVVVVDLSRSPLRFTRYGYARCWFGVDVYDSTRSFTFLRLIPVYRLRLLPFPVAFVPGYVHGWLFPVLVVRLRWLHFTLRLRLNVLFDLVTRLPLRLRLHVAFTFTIYVTLVVTFTLLRWFTFDSLVPRLHFTFDFVDYRWLLPGGPHLRSHTPLITRILRCCYRLRWFVVLLLFTILDVTVRWSFDLFVVVLFTTRWTLFVTLLIYVRCYVPVAVGRYVVVTFGYVYHTLLRFYVYGYILRLRLHHTFWFHGSRLRLRCCCHTRLHVYTLPRSTFYARLRLRCVLRFTFTFGFTFTLVTVTVCCWVTFTVTFHVPTRLLRFTVGLVVTFTVVTLHTVYVDLRCGCCVGWLTFGCCRFTVYIWLRLHVYVYVSHVTFPFLTILVTLLLRYYVLLIHICGWLLRSRLHFAFTHTLHLRWNVVVTFGCYGCYVTLRYTHLRLRLRLLITFARLRLRLRWLRCYVAICGCWTLPRLRCPHTLLIYAFYVCCVVRYGCCVGRVTFTFTLLLFVPVCCPLVTFTRIYTRCYVVTLIYRFTLRCCCCYVTFDYVPTLLLRFTFTICLLVYDFTFGPVYVAIYVYGYVTLRIRLRLRLRLRTLVVPTRLRLFYDFAFTLLLGALLLLLRCRLLPRFDLLHVCYGLRLHITLGFVTVTLLLRYDSRCVVPVTGYVATLRYVDLFGRSRCYYALLLIAVYVCWFYVTVALLLCGYVHVYVVTFVVGYVYVVHVADLRTLALPGYTRCPHTVYRTLHTRLRWFVYVWFPVARLNVDLVTFGFNVTVCYVDLLRWFTLFPATFTVTICVYTPRLRWRSAPRYVTLFPIGFTVDFVTFVWFYVDSRLHFVAVTLLLLPVVVTLLRCYVTFDWFVYVPTLTLIYVVPVCPFRLRCPVTGLPVTVYRTHGYTRFTDFTATLPYVYTFTARLPLVTLLDFTFDFTFICYVCTTHTATRFTRLRICYVDLRFTFTLLRLVYVVTFTTHHVYGWLLRLRFGDLQFITFVAFVVWLHFTLRVVGLFTLLRLPTFYVGWLRSVTFTVCGYGYTAFYTRFTLLVGYTFTGYVTVTLRYATRTRYRCPVTRLRYVYGYVWLRFDFPFYGYTFTHVVRCCYTRCPFTLLRWLRLFGYDSPLILFTFTHVVWFDFGCYVVVVGYVIPFVGHVVYILRCGWFRLPVWLRLRFARYGRGCAHRLFTTRSHGYVVLRRSRYGRCYVTLRYGYVYVYVCPVYGYVYVYHIHSHVDLDVTRLRLPDFTFAVHGLRSFTFGWFDLIPVTVVPRSGCYGYVTLRLWLHVPFVTFHTFTHGYVTFRTLLDLRFVLRFGIRLVTLRYVTFTFPFTAVTRSRLRSRLRLRCCYRALRLRYTFTFTLHLHGYDFVVTFTVYVYVTYRVYTPFCYVVTLRLQLRLRSRYVCSVVGYVCVDVYVDSGYVVTFYVYDFTRCYVLRLIYVYYRLRYRLRSPLHVVIYVTFGPGYVPRLRFVVVTLLLLVPLLLFTLLRYTFPFVYPFTFTFAILRSPHVYVHHRLVVGWRSPPHGFWIYVVVPRCVHVTVTVGDYVDLVTLLIWLRYVPVGLRLRWTFIYTRLDLRLRWFPTLRYTRSRRSRLHVARYHVLHFTVTLHTHTRLFWIPRLFWFVGRLRLRLLFPVTVWLHLRSTFTFTLRYWFRTLHFTGYDLVPTLLICSVTLPVGWLICLIYVVDLRSHVTLFVVHILRLRFDLRLIYRLFVVGGFWFVTTLPRLHIYVVTILLLLLLLRYVTFTLLLILFTLFTLRWFTLRLRLILLLLRLLFRWFYRLRYVWLRLRCSLFGRLLRSRYVRYTFVTFTLIYIYVYGHFTFTHVPTFTLILTFPVYVWLLIFLLRWLVWLRLLIPLRLIYVDSLHLRFTVGYVYTRLRLDRLRYVTVTRYGFTLRLRLPVVVARLRFGYVRSLLDLLLRLVPVTFHLPHVYLYTFTFYTRCGWFTVVGFCSRLHVPVGWLVRLVRSGLRSPHRLRLVVYIAVYVTVVTHGYYTRTRFTFTRSRLHRTPHAGPRFRLHGYAFTTHTHGWFTTFAVTRLRLRLLPVRLQLPVGYHTFVARYHAFTHVYYTHAVVRDTPVYTRFTTRSHTRLYTGYTHTTHARFAVAVYHGLRTFTHVTVGSHTVTFTPVTVTRFCHTRTVPVGCYGCHGFYVTLPVLRLRLVTAFGYHGCTRWLRYPVYTRGYGCGSTRSVTHVWFGYARLGLPFGLHGCHAFTTVWFAFFTFTFYVYGCTHRSLHTVYVTVWLPVGLHTGYVYTFARLRLHTLRYVCGSGCGLPRLVTRFGYGWFHTPQHTLPHTVTPRCYGCLLGYGYVLHTFGCCSRLLRLRCCRLHVYVWFTHVYRLHHLHTHVPGYTRLHYVYTRLLPVTHGLRLLRLHTHRLLVTVTTFTFTFGFPVGYTVWLLTFVTLVNVTVGLRLRYVTVTFVTLRYVWICCWFGYGYHTFTRSRLVYVVTLFTLLRFTFPDLLPIYVTVTFTLPVVVTLRHVYGWFHTARLHVYVYVVTPHTLDRLRLRLHSPRVYVWFYGYVCYVCRLVVTVTRVTTFVRFHVYVYVWFTHVYVWFTTGYFAGYVGYVLRCPFTFPRLRYPQLIVTFVTFDFTLRCLIYVYVTLIYVCRVVTFYGYVPVCLRLHGYVCVGLDVAGFYVYVRLRLRLRFTRLRSRFAVYVYTFTFTFTFGYVYVTVTAYLRSPRLRLRLRYGLRLRLRLRLLRLLRCCLFYLHVYIGFTLVGCCCWFTFTLRLHSVYVWLHLLLRLRCLFTFVRIRLRCGLVVPVYVYGLYCRYTHLRLFTLPLRCLRCSGCGYTRFHVCAGYVTVVTFTFVDLFPRLRLFTLRLRYVDLLFVCCCWLRCWWFPFTLLRYVVVYRFYVVHLRWFYGCLSLPVGLRDLVTFYPVVTLRCCRLRYGSFTLRLRWLLRCRCCTLRLRVYTAVTLRFTFGFLLFVCLDVWFYHVYVVTRLDLRCRFVYVCSFTFGGWFYTRLRCLVTLRLRLIAVYHTFTLRYVYVTHTRCCGYGLPDTRLRYVRCVTLRCHVCCTTFRSRWTLIYTRTFPVTFTLRLRCSRWFYVTVVGYCILFTDLTLIVRCTFTFTRWLLRLRLRLRLLVTFTRV